MIKAILFDFDGVLTLDATGSQSICNYICKVTEIDKVLFWSAYKKYNSDLLYGKTTHEAIWGDLCAAIGMAIGADILYASFINTPLDETMCRLVKELKQKGYKTALVTDNKKDRIDVISQHYHFEKLFDTITVSAEVGSGKDHSEIFDITLQSLGVKPEECVFIDNAEKNLIVPDEMGMKTICFDHEKRDFEKLFCELRNIDVES